MRVRPFLLSLAFCFVLMPGAVSAGMDEVPTESLGPDAVERTWKRAHFYVPADANPLGTGVLGGQRDLGSVARTLDSLAKGPPRPVVVYLHGCGGFGNSGSVNAGMLPRRASSSSRPTASPGRRASRPAIRKPIPALDRRGFTKTSSPGGSRNWTGPFWA